MAPTIGSKYYQEHREEILAQQKAYRQENKEKIKVRGKAYRQEHKEEKKAYDKAYYQENKEEINAYNKAYRQEHKEEKKAYNKAYRQEHKEERNAYDRSRRKTDPTFKLVMNCRNRVNLALKGKCKSKSTMELLGCTIDELWLHLEKQFQPGMTRENHGFGEGCWHVDHIKPCSSFDLSDPEQQKICFHYTNLQPLWQRDNLSKGAKFDE